jgi:acyl-CoA synthetase (AMP-forming)/AMP-acid ligase II
MDIALSQCLSDLIKARAALTPDAIAFLGEGGRSFTFRQLSELLDKVITTLNRMGVGREDRVALVLPNGPELAVTFLAVAAGATSAPLNPAYSQTEFEFYLTDLEAKALIIQAGSETPVLQVARGLKIPVIELAPRIGGETIQFELVGGLDALPRLPGFAKPEDEALVLHTSGTTSRPKMVPLTQANICATAHHIVRSLQLSPADRCLNVMPLFHIHGLMAVVLASVAAGASVACSPGFDAERFYAWMEEYHPTWYSAVPTMHQAVLARAGSNQRVITDNPLRFIRSSSASLPPRVMADLEQIFDSPVIEAYGMTEAAHQMASNPLPPLPRKPGSVGLPAGPRIAIMDGNGQLLPAGKPGEIVIRGPNVMGGYARNPEANRSAFADGWFRTGDEGMFDEDNYLFITGRIKEMINRGGEKVTPREVDEVFLDHPLVAQAVTFAIPHPTLGEDVATAVVLSTGAAITSKELRRYALSRLLPQKAPSRVLILDQIPKGPTGKLQRIGLAEKLAARLQPEYEPPDTDLELGLADLWKEVLQRDRIGVEDNFFACGGDSLLATQLIARVRAAFQIDLPLGSIFREPTIHEQALLLERILLDEVEALSDEEVDRSLQ